MPRWPLPVLFALLPSLAPAGSPPAKPARLGLCAACHGETGNATQPGIPHLAAQDRDYLAAALRQYKSGLRSAPAMRAAAGALSDADIDALAAWYAAQARTAGAAR
jgi:cytochrome c553